MLSAPRGRESALLLPGSHLASCAPFPRSQADSDRKDPASPGFAGAYLAACCRVGRIPAELCHRGLCPKPPGANPEPRAVAGETGRDPAPGRPPHGHWVPPDSWRRGSPGPAEEERGRLALSCGQVPGRGGDAQHSWQSSLRPEPAPGTRPWRRIRKRQLFRRRGASRAALPLPLTPYPPHSTPTLTSHPAPPLRPTQPRQPAGGCFPSPSALGSTQRLAAGEPPRLRSSPASVPWEPRSQARTTGERSPGPRWVAAGAPRVGAGCAFLWAAPPLSTQRLEARCGGSRQEVPSLLELFIFRIPGPGGRGFQMRACFSPFSHFWQIPTAAAGMGWGGVGWARERVHTGCFWVAH